MKISEIITDKYKLRIPPTVYYDLLADVREVEEGQEPKWIPVSERLPENAKHKGAFCPKYYVMTEFGQTEGWYNPDEGCWYVLLWFMDARFETWNISLERGDVPKLVKNVPVTAWMPLPEPYKPEKIRCNTCKNNDDELSGECYECIKGIFDHYEPQESEEV